MDIIKSTGSYLSSIGKLYPVNSLGPRKNPNKINFHKIMERIAKPFSRFKRATQGVGFKRDPLMLVNAWSYSSVEAWGGL